MGYISSQENPKVQVSVGSVQSGDYINYHERDGDTIFSGEVIRVFTDPQGYVVIVIKGVDGGPHMQYRFTSDTQFTTEFIPEEDDFPTEDGFTDEEDGFTDEDDASEEE